MGSTIPAFCLLFYCNRLFQSGNINYLSTVKLKSRSMKLILTIFHNCQKYKAREFCITDIHGDDEINNQSLAEALMPINMHLYANEKHIKFIKNAFKTIKERVWLMCHATLYKRYTSLMTQSILEDAVDLLKLFSSKIAFLLICAQPF